LLPSKELRELSKRVDICLSKKTSPKGCDIRFRQFYWLMVFDDRGELTGAYQLSKGLTAARKRGMKLPAALVSIVDAGLKAGPSLEELERRYLADRGSQKTLNALRSKIDAMDGVGQIRLADFLVATASKTADPASARAQGVLVEAAACDHQVINHAAYARLRRSIEGFIAEYPGHSSCTQLLEPLTNVAMKYTFDLRSRCRDYAKAWSSVESSEEAKAGLRKLSQRLLERCDAEVAKAEKKLGRMKPKAYGVLRLKARLGRAQETLDGLDAARTIGVMRPIHAEWRKDATAGLGEQETPEQRN